MFQQNGKPVRKSQPERGFSVVEMAIVFLIIAIVAAAFVPQVIAWMRAYRLNTGARNVATALQRARYIATSNNTRAGVSFPDLYNLEIRELPLDAGKEPIIKAKLQMPEGIAISDDAPKEIAFDGRGILTPMPKESPIIRVRGRNSYYINIIISPTGQVTLSSPIQGEEK